MADDVLVYPTTVTLARPPPTQARDVPKWTTFYGSQSYQKSHLDLCPLNGLHPTAPKSQATRRLIHFAILCTHLPNPGGDLIFPRTLFAPRSCGVWLDVDVDDAAGCSLPSGHFQTCIVMLPPQVYLAFESPATMFTPQTPGIRRD